MTYWFTFLRHGESLGNQNGIIQGQQDFPLSQTGISQARQLAQEWGLQSRHFDAIISSPLSRALNTAKIIQSRLQSPLNIEDIWKERSFGTLEGNPVFDGEGSSLLPKSPQLYDPLGKNGESEWHLYLRAGHAVQSLFRRPPGKYLVVSHGGLLNKVLTIIAGTKPEADYHGHYFILGNTGYANVVFDFDRNDWQFHAMVQPEFPIPLRGPSQNTSRFFFIRHAESEGNQNRVFQGQLETQLTPTGKTQVNKLSRFLTEKNSDLPIDGIISSPLIRAWETAEKISAQLDIPLHKSELLKEVNNGKLIGLTDDEINQQYPERRDRVNPYLPLGETGESWFELFLRGGKIIDDLVSRPVGNYLIISHGAILNSTIWSILGVVPQPGKRPPIFRFSNTGFLEMAYTPEEKLWRMLSLMSPDHYLPANREEIREKST